MGLQKNKRKLNHAGMTLLEVIVVLLILFIAGGGALFSVRMITRSNVNSCAKKLSTLLDKTRLETMSRTGSVRLEITKESGGYYGRIIHTADGTDSQLSKVNLGSAGLELTASTSLVTEMVTEGHPVIIRFQKGSGSQFTEYEQIAVTSARTAVVHLVRETGRNYIQ